MEDWKQALSALTGVPVPEGENGKEGEKDKSVPRRKREGMVYSTNPDYSFAEEDSAEQDTPTPSQQRLRLAMERAGRGGKTVTLIRGFVGSETELKTLCKELKRLCGVGGSVKDGEIIIQGDRRTQLLEILKKEGYTQTK